MQTVHIIVAIDRNGAIGRAGDMLYHLGADLRRFKRLTMGHPLIMGRKTFDSLPNGALPGRRNIVVTRNSQWESAGAERAGSLGEAFSLAGDGDVFVIGGGEIYRQAMPFADVLDITEIDAESDDADTFFEIENVDDYAVIEMEDAGTTPAARFVTYVRKASKGGENAEIKH